MPDPGASYNRGVLIRFITTPALSTSDLDAIRRIARAPIGQLQAQRSALIRSLRGQRFSRGVIRQFLRLTHAQVVSEQGRESAPDVGPFVRAPGARLGLL